MTSSQTIDIAAPASFRLKGGLYPLTQLDINHYQADQFQQDLANKVAEAPAFFRQTPVVLSFDVFDGDPTMLPLKEIRQTCMDYGLLPIAIRGSGADLAARALVAGMPMLTSSRKKSTPDDSATDEPAAQTQTADDVAQPQHEPSAQNRLVTSPIRSGQQVYAAGGDLIVVAPVSAGAEILADGNIHVYGPLRGRALAGVKGNREARIFCHSLEAELVSIAGDFKLDEDLRGALWKKSVQICLSDQTLEISEL
ncbi:septum site-determining protein MinC [Spongiibacter taiwanensis]|uniref:septum site-determining protein MinC n=1 Tax=Spongiibacter taiwanensis TaxID=1748242 RepID=UPI002034D112|nr:septum site-determining protein MinC [Spongiibacter taiwanensis]USA42231.1 septum site-determining protein MinC [Spongiibacter taiwanensis]